MNSTHFFIGQIGLFLGAGAGIALMDRLSRLDQRPSWYSFVVIWMKSAFASILLCQPRLLMSQYGTPSGVYYFFLMFGIERSVVLLDIIYPRRRLLSREVIRIMSLIGGLCLAIAVGWAVYSGIQQGILQNRKETIELKKEVKAAAKLSQSDTTRRSYITAKIDTLLEQSKRDQAQIALLLKSQIAKDKRIEELTRTVVYLTRSISSLSQTLERMRAGLIQVPAIQAQQSDPQKNSLIPDRVTKP